MPATISLLTDFGLSEEYVGEMKGAVVPWSGVVTQWKISKN